MFYVIPYKYMYVHNILIYLHSLDEKILSSLAGQSLGDTEASCNKNNTFQDCG